MSVEIKHWCDKCGKECRDVTNAWVIVKWSLEKKYGRGSSSVLCKEHGEGLEKLVLDFLNKEVKKDGN